MIASLHTFNVKIIIIIGFIFKKFYLHIWMTFTFKIIYFKNVKIENHFFSL